jgi:hypothetical protein
MRPLRQIFISKDAQIFALAEDGTFWTAMFGSEIAAQKLNWRQLNGPPEGNHLKPELTLEEQAERIRKKGGRKMLINRGKNDDKT